MKCKLQSGTIRSAVTRQLLFVWLVVLTPAIARGDQRQATMPGVHRELLKLHCFDCHDTATKEGSVDLETLSLTISHDMATAATWQKVLGVINSGEMPPQDGEPLPDDDKAALLKDLSEQMVNARQILSDSGGDITLRRLNRREYANTIEAIIGIRPDVSDLPNDQAVGGFDTQGASLFMSSDQIEQYLATARRSLELAILPRKRIESQTNRHEPEQEYTPHYAAALAEMIDKEKRAAAYFAQDEKPPSDFGYLDEYQVKKQRFQEWRRLMEDYLARPETKTGITLIMTIKQGGYTKVKLPVLQPHQDGDYLIRVRAAAYPEADERLHYLEFSSGYGTGRTRLGWRKVTGTFDQPQIIEFPIKHQPGEKQQIWIHQRSHQDRGDKNLATIDMRENGVGTVPGLWIDWAEMIGPEPDHAAEKSAKSVLPNRPEGWSDERYAGEVLRQFAVRAFRGTPPSDEYLDRLQERFLANRAEGEDPIDALIGPLSIILSSPSFLYLVEEHTDGSPHPSISPSQLATRLSFFLWSCPPDEELMRLATAGELSDPAILRQQTDRLLTDPRSDEFVRGFVHQWLQMDRLDMFQFNGGDFRTFDNAARENARQEIYQTVRYLTKEKLPLQSLLQSDFVVINDLLAGYYELSGVDGHEFRRVDLPDGSRRGGLLGTAAILAMGSDGQRSSPVERGAWVLRHLLHDPPPPAPPNVPQLSRLAGEVLPARELARAHQEQPQCANCHQKIDPIGYALENFDAAGKWRDQELIGTGKRRFGKWTATKSFPIDPSGELSGGESFADYFELRDVVAGHGDDFAKGFAESLISYGLGRPYAFVDQDLRDEILSHASANDDSVESFLHALVQSQTFQSK